MNKETIKPKDIKGPFRKNFATLVAINQSADLEEIHRLFSTILAEPLPETSAIFTPFHTNGGGNIRIGAHVFINHDCSILDLGGVTIDEGVMIAPRVTISSEAHPLDPTERHTLLTQPVHIKRGAWIGAGAIILPGITIGENAVVGAGAVVNKDVPDNTVVAGVPAKVIREV